MSKIIIDSNGKPYMDSNGKILTVELTPSLQSKSVSPATSQQVVTPDSGYDGLEKVTVGAVTAAIDANIQAGNIKSGVTILGVTGTLDAPAIQADLEYKQRGNTTLGATGLKLTVNQSGTYRISWVAARTYNSGTFSTRAYVNGSAVGTDHTTWTSTYFQQVVETGIALTAGQEVEVYARSSSTTRYTLVGNLVIEKTS